MKNPPADLARRLLDASEEILATDPPPRLEDVARSVGASRATLYYYFAGREDLVAFLIAAHVRQGAEAVEAAVKPDDPAETRLRSSIAALVAYLGGQPGVCAGLLGAAAAAGRMSEVFQAKEAWIAGPMRELLRELDVPEPADAVHASLGAIMFAVLGRSMAGGDTTDRRFQRRLTEQVVRGALVPAADRRRPAS